MLHSILIIDDDPIFTEILKLFFEQLGTKIVNSSQSIAEAIEFLKQVDPPSLITLDLNMPNFDCIEFLRELKKISYPGSVTIISADAPMNIETAASLATMHGLKVVNGLNKPLTPDDVGNWVSSLHA